MKILLKRMLRVIRLDLTLFDEIINDPSSQGQSVWAAALFAMATAFGIASPLGGTVVNIMLLTTIITWYAWAFSISYIGTRLFAKKADPALHKTIMRVVAFACAPGLVRLLGLLPKATVIMLIISSIWIIASAVIGLKKVFIETETAKVAALVLVTWVITTIFQGILTVTLLSVFGISS